ncbi:MAG: DUF4433 domain-containing protein [Polyangiales bacterium]
MPGAIPPNPLIFHITHVKNLARIIAHGCLWSDAQGIAKSLATTNIGYSHIKLRRLNRAVTAGSGGKLGDYVPFNFCKRSVMLFVVSRGHADYKGGQDEIVHLVSSVKVATALGKSWAFTDRHADLTYATYYASLDKPSEVDWSLMSREYWAESEDMKERRQAEFLVHDNFPWAAVERIGVKSNAVAAKVKALLRSGTPTVVVQPDWYY